MIMAILEGMKKAPAMLNNRYSGNTASQPFTIDNRNIETVDSPAPNNSRVFLPTLSIRRPLGSMSMVATRFHAEITMAF